jgi:hypothetical protein
MYDDLSLFVDALIFAHFSFLLTLFSHDLYMRT